MTSIFNINPYESHPTLTTTEAEVLWEYAKLAQHVKLVGKLSYLQYASPLRKFKVTQKTRLLSEEPDRMLLARLRVLEKKMGLVLTLVAILTTCKHPEKLTDMIVVQSFSLGCDKRAACH
jgi:DASH complex subunit Dad3